MNNGIYSGFTRGGVSPIVTDLFYPGSMISGSSGDEVIFSWTRPQNVEVVQFHIVGAGGGGGSGRKGAAATARVGGGGGAGGGYTIVTYMAADLPQQLNIAVGVGGWGGAPVSANDTDGNSGGSGGSSKVGGFANQSQVILGYAYGGGGGAGGGNGGFRAGALHYSQGIGGDGQFPGGPGGHGPWDCSANGVGGTDILTAAGFPGGGAGGGISIANTQRSGGGGGRSVTNGTVSAAGGAAATDGEDGFSYGLGADTAGFGPSIPKTPRTGIPSPALGSGGGGGGASSSATPAGKGGTTTATGAGGGGGGAALNTTTPHSGHGGHGGHGLVVVIGWG